MLMPTGLSNKEREAYIKSHPNPKRTINPRITNKHVGLRSPKPEAKAKPSAASSR